LSLAATHFSGTGRLLLALAGAILLSAGALVLPSRAAAGGLYETYAIQGYEVWYAPTVGTFVGTGAGTDGFGAALDLNAWHARIEHDELLIPSGRVTGGKATLYRLDGVRIEGYFSDGLATQTYPGPECTTEYHTVTGTLRDVTSSARPGVTGVGHFSATLVHYRAHVFGSCYAYSASVSGTITVWI
jgi:hypothetical protein